MTSFRKNSELLLAVLAVFVNEPISEWMDQANNLRASENSVEGSRVLSYARKKIDIARMKLQGITDEQCEICRFPHVVFSDFEYLLFRFQYCHNYD
jgi:hypothetical protein